MKQYNNEMARNRVITLRYVYAMLLNVNAIVNIPPGLQMSIVYQSLLSLQCIYENVFTVIIYNTRVYWYYSQFQWVQLCDWAVRDQSSCCS